MALDNILAAKYLQRNVVRQRNQITLTQWAAYTATEPIPSPATDAWVQQRIVAEQMPIALDAAVQSTLGYFLQDPATVSGILQFISEDNDTATEQTLSDNNQAICGTFMPRYAAITVTAQQVADWRTRNNAPAPPSKESRNE